MVVFTSFTPDELVLSETSSSGMKLLKKFLEFAAPDGHISVSSSNGLSLRDRHREEIATALEEKGFRVVQNLGLSNFRVDIAIADPADPEKCILGIMLDGKGWKARSSTADRDLLPTLVLKGNMKWPAVERMWLPMWLRDRDGELARISHAVEVAVSERELRAKQEAEASVNIEDNSGEEPSENITGLISISDLMASAESQVETVESPASGKTSKATTLGVNIDEIQHLKILGDTMLVPDKTYIQYLQHPKIRELLLDIADQLTNIEGPVSGTRFVQFVAKCFGLTGVKSARAEEILASLPKEIHKRDEEGFIYPKNTAPYEFKDWYKQSPGFGRALSDISLVELSNAMATLCSQAAGMESSELAKQTSLAFGTGKLTKLADKRMFDAERLGIKRGILVVHDDIVMAANS
jgi:hypothetical protein